MSERRRLSGAVTIATGILLLLLAIRPLSPERLFSIYVLLLTAIALASLTRTAQPPPVERRLASRFEQALRARQERPVRPPELVRTERELTLGVASTGHAERRLLPLLREAAAARLLAAHGIDATRRPEQARAVLGEDVWDLVRPDRPEPADRDAPGVPLARIAGVIDRLEQL